MSHAVLGAINSDFFSTYLLQFLLPILETSFEEFILVRFVVCNFIESEMFNKNAGVCFQ